MVYNQEYLVLKRSDRVSTMRGLWSAVSGTIDAGEEPLAQARKEILEETGIGPDLLHLHKSAPTLEIYSNEHECSLQVHGFLFESSTANVCLNWESSDYRWVTREELCSLDAVVGLSDVLDALL